MLEERRAWLARFVAEQGVQTNEVQRCAGLLPCFLEIARRAGPGVPLDLLELGPSAGLNLGWDRYRYDLGGLHWGPTDSPLLLRAAAAPPPSAELLETPVAVRGRVGLDLAPVEVRSEQGSLLLEAFVWADQRQRLERVRRAIEIARRSPPELLAGDYVELLPSLLARRPADGLTVVFETASTPYLRDDDYERLLGVLEEAGRGGPLAWLSPLCGAAAAAGRGYALCLRLWPDGEAETLALLDYHGEWLEWHGP